VKKKNKSSWLENKIINQKRVLFSWLLKHNFFYGGVTVSTGIER